MTALALGSTSSSVGLLEIAVDSGGLEAGRGRRANRSSRRGGRGLSLVGSALDLGPNLGPNLSRSGVTGEDLNRIGMRNLTWSDPHPQNS